MWRIFNESRPGLDVLVRFADGRATFRCPTLLIFGRDYSHPFVPWPSYTQGETASAVPLRSITDAQTARGTTSPRPLLTAPERAAVTTDPYR